MVVVVVSQWLCPDRHCIIALCWDSRQTNEKAVERQGIEMFGYGVIMQRCGICKSETIQVEHQRTMFDSVDQARPDLARLEGWNHEARVYFEPRERGEKNGY